MPNEGRFAKKFSSKTILLVFFQKRRNHNTSPITPTRPEEDRPRAANNRQTLAPLKPYYANLANSRWLLRAFWKFRVISKNQGLFWA